MSNTSKAPLVVIALLVLIVTLQCGPERGRQEKEQSVTGTEESDTAVIVFREYEHNFGKVAEGEKVGYTFLFENGGKGNLAILSVSTSCGCTVPKYDKKPVRPGDKGTLEVVFDTSGRTGIQSKMITVRSNASVPVVMLKITAEVTESARKR